MAFGTMLLGLGLFLSGSSSKLWHFYLGFGVLSGAGLCLAGSVPFTAVIRNWFERKRGLALSLLFFGIGGAFVFYPAIAFSINSVGWRNTFFIEAMVIAALMLPLILLIVRYHPREKGLLADGVSESMDPCPAPREMGPQIVDQAWASIDWTLAKAARTGRFWLLCLATFSVWGIVQQTMVTHHVAFALDLGYSRVYASSILSLHGVLFAFGSLAGVLSDRIGREITMTIGTIIGISGIFILTIIRGTSQSWMLYYYATAVGFSLGMTTPTIAASTIDIFQGPKAGAVIGFVWFSFSLGGCIGPWLGGWIFEWRDSYLIAFIVAMVCYAMGCGAIWWASPRKVRLVAGPGKMGERDPVVPSNHRAS
jgi:MFS family permease